MTDTTYGNCFGYANRFGYSDVEPYEIVRRVSDKTIEVRGMKSERDPSWQMDFRRGGFLGTVVNQEDQKWIITSQPEGRVFRIRLHADGAWRCPNGERYVLGVKPIKFYDYNF
jgi:hypothetical protein